MNLSEMRWYVFEEDGNASEPGMPGWVRTAGRDRQGRAYAPGALTGESENQMLARIIRDRIPSLLQEGHLYVPLDWLLREWPTHPGPKAMAGLLDCVAKKYPEQHAPLTDKPIVDPGAHGVH